MICINKYILYYKIDIAPTQNFPWKFLQKSLKCVNFLIYLQKNLNDLSIVKFWFKIHIPSKVSNYLMGHIVHFYIEIKLSYFKLPWVTVAYDIKILFLHENV